MTRLALVLALAFAGTALAEGPGSQLRTTPEIPQATPMPTNPVRQDQKRCEALPTEQRQQCLAELRTVPTPRPNGPESIGGGAGAATGSGSGTTGGATFGGSAPR
jgi:hypothetical protein